MTNKISLSNGKDILYNIAKLFTITFFIAYSCLVFTNVKMSMLALVFSLLIINIFSVGIFIMGKKSGVVLGLLIIIVIICAKIFGHFSVISLLYNSFLWSIDYLLGSSLIIEKYQIISFSIFLFLLNILLITLERYRYIKILLCCLFIFILFDASIMEYRFGKVAIMLGLAYILHALIDLAQNPKEKIIKKPSINILFFAIFIVLISGLLTSKETPIQWNKFFTLFDGNNGNNKDSSESIGTKRKVITGFTNSDYLSLGTDMRLSDLKLFTFSQDLSEGEGYYFTGIIRDKYDGTGWTNTYRTYTENIPENQKELYEKVYNLYRSNVKSSSREYFCRKLNVNIIYSVKRLRSIIYPYNSVLINCIDNDLEALGQNIYFDKLLDESTYSATVLDLNEENEELIDYLKNIKDYTGLDSNVKNLETLYNECVNSGVFSDAQLEYILSDEFSQVLSDNEKNIETYYLQLPSELPDRVYDLAKTITEDKSSDYEKIMAVKEYLGQYEYSLNPGIIPDNEDAVDYFLFDSKKGYCVYFASSMAVLLRCIDIPTRYVEGVYTDYSEMVDDSFVVRNYNAHAWVEAYIKGYGWLKVDPTFDRSTSNIWSRSNKSLYSEQKGNRAKAKENNKTLIEDNKYKKYIAISMYILLIVFLTVLVRMIVVGRKRYRMFISLSVENRFNFEMIIIFKYLQYINDGIEDGETLSQYICRIKDYSELSDIFLVEILREYEKIRYSSSKVTGNTLEKTILVRRNLESICKEGKNKYKFLLRKMGLFNKCISISKNMN